MKVKAICPGSCGELIQGFIRGRELLVSYPINLFSEVTLTETSHDCKHQGAVKARMALEKSFEFFNLPVEYTYNIKIHINSSIPVGKGMASSTADIGAVIKAAAFLAGKSITVDELVDIAVSIEPTDSVLFEGLTLFDPLNGGVREHLGDVPSLDVLVLEPEETLDTLEFRKKDYSEIKKKNQGKIEHALELLKEGLKTGNTTLIGKAATISSVANDEVLKKPNLKAIIDCAVKAGAVGVNVAHSGTVIGILIDRAYTTPDKVKASLIKKALLKPFKKIYSCKMFRGRLG